MKLIIQSDDLGITEAVSCGIARAAREGAITCTGLFSNMPAAAFSVELMKSYPQICLGEDINLVAGRPCADPEKIPSLVQKDGSFLTSGMHRAIDQKDGNQDHVRLEDCLIETEAQILKFRELTGKLPEYLHGHSYSTPATWKAMEEMGKKYGISLVREMHDKYGIKRPSKTWYKTISVRRPDESRSYRLCDNGFGIFRKPDRFSGYPLRLCRSGTVSCDHLYYDPNHGSGGCHRRTV